MSRFFPQERWDPASLPTRGAFSRAVVGGLSEARRGEPSTGGADLEKKSRPRATKKSAGLVFAAAAAAKKKDLADEAPRPPVPAALRNVASRIDSRWTDESSSSSSSSSPRRCFPRESPARTAQTKAQKIFVPSSTHPEDPGALVTSPRSPPRPGITATRAAAAAADDDDASWADRLADAEARLAQCRARRGEVAEDVGRKADSLEAMLRLAAELCLAREVRACGGETPPPPDLDETRALLDRLDDLDRDLAFDGDDLDDDAYDDTTDEGEVPGPPGRFS